MHLVAAVLEVFHANHHSRHLRFLSRTVEGRQIQRLPVSGIR